MNTYTSESKTTLLTSIGDLYSSIAEKVNLLQPLALLAARLYVGWAFFASGLTKLNDWDSTLFLFEEEYNVPILPFELAAYLGTAGELILPILLVLGLMTRFAAVGLFFVNIVAVISLADIPPLAYAEHILWGVLLAQIVIFSGGFLTVDRFIKKLFNHKR
jgi:putative oxidoreductase